MQKSIVFLRDQDGLVLAPDHHALEGSLGDGENVGRHLVPPLAHVDLHGALRVDWEPLKTKIHKKFMSSTNGFNIV